MIPSRSQVSRAHLLGVLALAAASVSVAQPVHAGDGKTVTLIGTTTLTVDGQQTTLRTLDGKACIDPLSIQRSLRKWVGGEFGGDCTMGTYAGNGHYTVSCQHDGNELHGEGHMQADDDKTFSGNQQVASATGSPAVRIATTYHGKLVGEPCGLIPTNAKWGRQVTVTTTSVAHMGGEAHGPKSHTHHLCTSDFGQSWQRKFADAPGGSCHVEHVQHTGHTIKFQYNCDAPVRATSQVALYEQPDGIYTGTQHSRMHIDGRIITTEKSIRAVPGERCLIAADD